MTVESLRNAYRQGIFPLAIEGLPLPCFCPDDGCLILQLHIPRTLQGARKTIFLYIDKDFRRVSELRQNSAHGRERNVVTKDFSAPTPKFHEAGISHRRGLGTRRRIGRRALRH